MNYLAPEETAAAAEIIAPYSSLAAGLFRESRTKSWEYEGVQRGGREKITSSGNRGGEDV
jgi:hypothetical protein